MTLAAGLGLGLAVISTASVGAASANSSGLIVSRFDMGQINDCGASCRVFIDPAGGSNFTQITVTPKWTELKSTATGLCLDIVGNVTAGFNVNEESCNGRAAELWWLVPERGSQYDQVINDYGTSLYGHDACMWNPDPTGVYGALVTVQKCVPSQPPRQQWDL